MEEIPEAIRDSDWKYAFECCGEPEDEETPCNSPQVSAAIGKDVSPAPFQRKDVADVIATSDGENDGDNWIGVFLLKDGRFAFLTAGCDYTGWGCRSGGHAIVDDDLVHLIQFGLGEDDRARLNLGAQSCES